MWTQAWPLVHVKELEQVGWIVEKSGGFDCPVDELVLTVEHLLNGSYVAKLDILGNILSSQLT